MIRDYYVAGNLEELFDELLKDSLDDKARTRLAQIHPTFMGGEYLPNYGRQEVEIARMTLESTTSDVISLRARPAGSRIKYHITDEYQTEFSLPQKTSSRPYFSWRIDPFPGLCGAPGCPCKLEALRVCPVVQSMQLGLWNRSRDSPQFHKHQL
jgi:hypothetical protein